MDGRHAWLISKVGPRALWPHQVAGTAHANSCCGLQPPRAGGGGMDGSGFSARNNPVVLLVSAVAAGGTEGRGPPPDGAAVGQRPGSNGCRGAAAPSEFAGAKGLVRRPRSSWFPLRPNQPIAVPLRPIGVAGSRPPSLPVRPLVGLRRPHPFGCCKPGCLLGIRMSLLRRNTVVRFLSPAATSPAALTSSYGFTLPTDCGEPRHRPGSAAEPVQVRFPGGRREPGSCLEFFYPYQCHAVSLAPPVTAAGPSAQRWTSSSSQRARPPSRFSTRSQRQLALMASPCCTAARPSSCSRPLRKTRSAKRRFISTGRIPRVRGHGSSPHALAQNREQLSPGGLTHAPLLPPSRLGISEKTVSDDVLFGEIMPDHLDSFRAVVNHVFVPCLKAQENWGHYKDTKEFLQTADRFCNTLTEAVNSLHGGIELDKPETEYINKIPIQASPGAPCPASSARLDEPPDSPARLAPRLPH